MNLENVGHGQTLVPYTKKYEGVDRHYFLVCAGAIRSEGFDYWEAKSVGRIKYQPGATINQIDSFVNVEYSNKTRSLFANLRRCAVNLSIDGETMLMFKQSTSGNVQYSFYDFNAIKKALDSNSTNDRSFRYNDKLAAACDSDVINADNVPNRQLQGIAIDNYLNIYTCSDGKNNYNCRAIISVIFKSSKRTYSYNVYGDIVEILYYLHGQVSDLELEIEGIQILNDKIYIGMAPKNQDIRNNAFIYSVELSDIHEI